MARVGIIPAPAIVAEIDLPENIEVNDGLSVLLPVLGLAIVRVSRHVTTIHRRASATRMTHTQGRDYDQVVGIVCTNTSTRTLGLQPHKVLSEYKHEISPPPNHQNSIK